MSRPVVLVTGAARRLGASIARRFAEAGYHVVVHCNRSCDEAERLAASLASAESCSADLADPDAIEAMVRELARRHDNWSVLVNSAAIFEPDTHEEIDPAVFTRSMAINAAAPAMLAQCFLHRSGAPYSLCAINLLDQKIANMNPDFFSYTMAKQALYAATQMLAMASAGTAHRVYGLCPGAMLPSHDQRSEEHLRSGRMNLLSRLTLPDELADAALFLAEGKLASGQMVFVDSGQHLLHQRRDVLYLAREEAEESA